MTSVNFRCLDQLEGGLLFTVMFRLVPARDEKGYVLQKGSWFRDRLGNVEVKLANRNSGHLILFLYIRDQVIAVRVANDEMWTTVQLAQGLLELFDFQ